MGLLKIIDIRIYIFIKNAFMWMYVLFPQSLQLMLVTYSSLTRVTATSTSLVVCETIVLSRKLAGMKFSN